jgi:DNA topoisomerase I
VLCCAAAGFQNYKALAAKTKAHWAGKMAGKSLIIVESPTKAKTITKFLGKEYTVRASNGHIRDLPNSASEIPAKLKKEPWAKLGVNIESGFAPLYVIPKNKKDNVNALKEEIKKADALYLATDEDREGESISWHLLEILKPKVPTKRLVFHEITKEAIEQALKNPREIDLNLVRAQETRRIVDRLFGYEVSPLLWKKMAPRLSAGRVQSVAVRLLVERERERIRFHEASFWDLKAVFQKHDAKDSENQFEADLTQVDGKRVAAGKDFDPETGILKPDDKIVALDENAARQLKNRVLHTKPVVSSVEEKPYSTNPPAPFVTSSLQQEANRKLRYSAKRTMGVAQQLYENGFITYMRTDSTTLSEQALAAARSFIKSDFGEEYLPPKPRQYATKVKNAQEAHEAIRPAGDAFTPPQVVRQKLGDEAFRLYELIWKRTVASQMQNARGTHIAVNIAAGEATFRATGKTIAFAGFLRAYVEGSDDPESELADREKILPNLHEGENVKLIGLDPAEHVTQSPARYTEGNLIRELERRGIGRPSTWAQIVELVLSRQYAFKKGTALVPTFTAMAVVGMLEQHFASLLDYEFTARLEDYLDSISRGEAENVKYLSEFYYGNGYPGLKSLVKQGETTIDPREVCGVHIGQEEDGTEVEVRIGRYGPFLTNGTQRASVPDDMAPDELKLETAVKLLVNAGREPEALGMHPETGEPVFLKSGPYGPYVQLGNGGTQAKPKMVSLLPKMTPEQMDLACALKLLSLPRTLGEHPETQHKVVVAVGRFGPYLKCDKETRSIPVDRFSPLEMTLEQALELLNEPKGKGRNNAKPALIRELGKHPVSGSALNIFSGRYGPYVSDGTLNASLGKTTKPEELTVDAAVELLEARAARGDIVRPRRGRSKKG